MERSELLHVLKAELAFFETGNYGRPFRGSWRPTLLIRDSPTCLTAGFPGGRERCHACKLWPLVPADKAQELIPCHYIPLNAQGRTIADFYRNGTQESLDRTYGEWLHTLLQQLENQ
jgi:hypothetical protein